MQFLSKLFTMLMFLTITSVSHAEIDSTTIHFNITPEFIESTLTELGLPFNSTPDGYVVLINKIPTMLLVDGKYIQFRATFEDSEKIATISRLNEWNRNMIFSKAYRLPSKEIVIEAEQDVSGGVTQSTIVVLCVNFKRSLERFIKVMFERQSS